MLRAGAGAHERQERVWGTSILIADRLRDEHISSLPLSMAMQREKWEVWLAGYNGLLDPCILKWLIPFLIKQTNKL